MAVYADTFSVTTTPVNVAPATAGPNGAALLIVPTDGDVFITDSLTDTTADGLSIGTTGDVSQISLSLDASECSSGVWLVSAGTVNVEVVYQGA